MANICEYKVKVIGKKNACYALFGSIRYLDSKEIVSESGTENDYILFLHGYCKWTVDQYTSAYDGTFDIVIPDNPKEAEEFGNAYDDYNLKSCSKLFNVEVWCNSVDIDDPMGVDSVHYIDGEEDINIAYEDMPREIEMDEYHDMDAEVGNIYRLYFEEEMSVEEIATTMGLDEDYVRSVLDCDEEE